IVPHDEKVVALGRRQVAGRRRRDAGGGAGVFYHREDRDLGLVDGGKVSAGARKQNLEVGAEAVVCANGRIGFVGVEVQVGVEVAAYAVGVGDDLFGPDVL